MKKHLVTMGKSVCFFALWVAGIALTSLPPFDGPSFIKNDPAFLRIWWELLPLLITMLLTFLFVGIIEKSKIKINVFKKPFRDCVLGIAFGCIWIGLVIVILMMIGAIRFESTNTIRFLAIWIAAVLLNVMMQEYLVRGYLFQLLKEKYGVTFATIITTILFTVMHGGAFEAGIVAVLNVVTMSIMMSLLLIYTHNLLAPILAHFIWNMVGCCVFGIVSLAEDYPSIFNTVFHGGSLLTGGAAKIEGSVVTLVVNILLIAVMSVMLTKRKNKVQTL